MNFLKKILFISSLTLLSVQFSLRVYSQVEDFDSLIFALEGLPENEARVDHLTGLANAVMFNDPNLSFDYASEALSLALDLGYEKSLIGIYKTIGNINATQGDNSGALKNYLSSLEKASQFGDSLNMAKVYNNIGILYDNQNNYDEAKVYYQRALKIFISLSDFEGQATIYNNIGFLLDNAEQYDSAISYYHKTLLINKELKNESLDAFAFGNLGFAYMHKEVFDTARIFFDRSMGLFKELKDNNGIAEQYSNLGELKLKEGNYQESFIYLEKSEKLASKYGFNSILVKNYRLMSEAHRELGQFETALKYHERYRQLADSISNAEYDRALYELQVKQEHEQAMAKLNLEKQIRDRTARLQNYLLIVVTGFLLIVMLISAYYFKNRQKITRQLKKQNKEIIKQQREIENQRKKVVNANIDLKGKNVKLNQLNKDKDFLLHVVAHDLKNPLNQMAGLSKVILLEKELLSETQKDCLEKIDTVSSRLSSMVDKILDIDAIDKKSYNMNLEETDLRIILEEAVSDFENAAKSKNIRIHTNLNGGACRVRLDQHHAMQIFLNLISNAIKFSPPDKEIYVNLTQNDFEVIAEIVDQGPGLTSEDKEKVFEKFQKLSAQPTANEESSGLGLSIVKKYVEAMHGKVWVESESGEGAKFNVSFRKIKTSSLKANQ